MKKRIRRRQNITPDLDITAFMNLMVILVPFLLITAVFSRITVLDLYLPPESTSDVASKEKFRLEIVIRSQQIAIREASSGFVKILRAKNGVFDYQQLSDSLALLKQDFPSKQAAAIMPEPDVSYDVLIQVMDRVRMREKNSSGTQDRVSNIEYEVLFPSVSIGDAPPDVGVNRPGIKK